METIKSVIETLKEKYPYFQQPVLEPIPNLPEPSTTLNPEDTLFVIRIKNGYRIEDVLKQQTFTVTKVNGFVYCTCPEGKTLSHCCHKRAVIKEARLIKKMRIDECQKRSIAAGISSYSRTLERILAVYERAGDVNNSAYWLNRGKYLACKHMLRTVIEA